MGSGTTLKDVTESFRELADGAATISPEAVNKHFGSAPPVAAVVACCAIGIRLILPARCWMRWSTRPGLIRP